MTWRSWLVLVLLALAGYLVSGLTQVRPGEVGVVRRLGQVVDVVAPGLHLGLPWGFGRVDRVAIDEQRQLNVGYVDRDDPLPDRLPVGQVLTADDQLLNLRITLFFRVDAA
ncbi:MAG TPA: SPFH domain-containing protein, partial [Gemmatales bacterium]|nr:SPFH domain-containing protein [Gemmatales bacterium]